MGFYYLQPSCNRENLEMREIYISKPRIILRKGKREPNKGILKRIVNEKEIKIRIQERIMKGNVTENSFDRNSRNIRLHKKKEKINKKIRYT